MNPYERIKYLEDVLLVTRGCPFGELGRRAVDAEAEVARLRRTLEYIRSGYLKWHDDITIMRSVEDALNPASEKIDE